MRVQPRTRLPVRERGEILASHAAEGRTSVKRFEGIPVRPQAGERGNVADHVRALFRPGKLARSKNAHRLCGVCELQTMIAMSDVAFAVPEWTYAAGR